MEEEEGNLEGEVELYQSWHIILENVVNEEYNEGVSDTLKRFARFLLAKNYHEIEEIAKEDERFMGLARKAKSFWDMDLRDIYEACGLEEKMKHGIKMTGIQEGKAIGLEEGKTIGLEEGRKNAILETACSLIENGVSEEVVSKSTNLPLKQVKSLKKSIDKKNQKIA